MGGTNWSTDFYQNRQQERQRTGASAFAYHDTVSRVKPSDQKIHDLMNPYGVVIRESRDSAKHPESNAVILGLDITGSMDRVPVVLQKKLSNLMDTIIGRGYLPHPQIMISAIGDATSDKAAFQVGQFESGIEIDDDLGRIWLEGMGGGQVRESYELAMYFYARHTSIDCFEKRGRKGYCFIIGDERAYEELPDYRINQVFGDSLEGQILTVQDVVKELKEKYHLYFIVPTHTYHGRDPSIHQYWKNLVGPENTLILDDEGAICELITMTIGLCEGKVDLDQAADDLLSSKSDSKAVNAAVTALDRVSSTTQGNIRL